MQKWSIYDDVVNQSNRLYILARIEGMKNKTG